MKLHFIQIHQNILLKKLPQNCQMLQYQSNLKTVRFFNILDLHASTMLQKLHNGNCQILGSLWEFLYRAIPFYFRWCRLVNSPPAFTIKQITKICSSKMPSKTYCPDFCIIFSEVFSEELLINNHCRFKCKIEAQYVYESLLLVMHMTLHDLWVT